MINSEKYTAKYLLTAVIGGGLSALVAWWMLQMAFSDRYPQLLPLAFGIMMLFIAAYCILTMFAINDITIYDDKIEARLPLGKLRTIYPDEITGWTESIVESKGKKTSRLIIYTYKGKIRLSSNYYKNYDELKEALVKDKYHNTELQRTIATTNRRYVFGIMTIAAVIFFSVQAIGYRNDSIPVAASSLTSVTDIIVNKVRVITGSKGHKYVNIKLRSYPEFTFQLDGRNLMAANTKAYVNEVNTGDSITLDISTDAYLKKLTGQQPLGFFDKTVNYSDIYVYGLRANGNTYLSLANYNAQSNSGRTFALGLSICLIAFCLYICIGVERKIKMKTE